MREDFLHFLWKFQLFDKEGFTSTTGEPIEIVQVGSHNTHSGPDFFNAKVKIADKVWAGNIEIHWKTSDWIKHNHHRDRAYDNVILHVVVENDVNGIKHFDGSLITCATIRYNSALESRYREMLDSTEWVACQEYLPKIDSFVSKQLLGRLLIERLGGKVELIENELARTRSNWEEVFYVFLFKAFGFSINALPFEILAKSLSYNIILKHRSSLLSIEALLFGQAGMLEGIINDEYHRNLKSEYTFLKSKYKLKPLESSVWKFLRTRPQNFPTIRIAQLASVLYNRTNLFSEVVSSPSFAAFTEIFEKVEVSKYWRTHYTFGQVSGMKEKGLGDNALNLLAINLWVPFVFAYGHLNDDCRLKERALDFLDLVDPEENAIISNWKELGMPADSAYYTQALLHLKKEYCDVKRCLCCSIGKRVVEGFLD